MNNELLNLVKPYEIDNEINNNIFFVHIPKCGGTTIDNIFLRCSYATKTFEWLRLKDRQKDIFEIKNNINVLNNKFFLSGHLNENFFDDLANKPIKTSIIRNPIDRTISHYKFHIYKNKIDIKNYPLEQYLNETVENFTDNPIVRILSNTKTNNQTIDKRQREIAIKNIKKFHLYADYSEWGKFTQLLISFFKFPNVLYAKYQKYSYTFKYKPNQKDIELLKKYYELDMAFFDIIFAKQKIFSKINLSKFKKKIINKFLLVNIKSIQKNQHYIISEEDLKNLNIKINTN